MSLRFLSGLSSFKGRSAKENLSRSKTNKATSHPQSASETNIAVSFAKAASENQMAVAIPRRRTYASNPQKQNTAAAKFT